MLVLAALSVGQNDDWLRGFTAGAGRTRGAAAPRPSPSPAPLPSILVVYAHAAGELRDFNLDFFLKQALIPMELQPAPGSSPASAKAGSASTSTARVPAAAAGGSLPALPPGTLTPAASSRFYIHYALVINGDVDAAWRRRLDRIASLVPNFEVHYRSNFGYDICAHKETLLDTLPDGKLKRAPGTFTHYFLMNGSVRGPFMAVLEAQAWPEVFLGLLSQRNVRLAGTSINCWRDALTTLHVQTMFLAFPAAELPVLLRRMECMDDKWQLILTSELGLSRAVLDTGGNVAVTQMYWRGHDFQDPAATSQRCAVLHGKGDFDAYITGFYQGIDINPLEVVFFKANRKVAEDVLERYTRWQLELRPWALPKEAYE